MMSVEVDCGCYFDAVEDSVVASTSGSDYESANEEDECVRKGSRMDMSMADGFSSGFLYDVWTRSPISVQERRKLFRKWLGWREYVSNDNDISEVDSGSVVETTRSSLSPALNDSYLSWSSMLPSSDSLTDSSQTNICRIRNSGDATDCIADDLKLNAQVTICNQVDDDNSRVVRHFRILSRSCSFQDTEVNKRDKLTDTTDTTKGNKNKWLRRLRTFTCTMDTQVKLDSVERSMSECSRHSPRCQRVKVHQCRKKIKELSAVYMAQEIFAHRGSILAMKFSPDGQFLASAGDDMIVRVWQVVEEDRSISLDMPDLDPSCLYFTVNHLSDLAPLFVDKERLGKLQALKKSSDSACVIFPPKVFRISEKPLHEFVGHSGAVLDLSWSNKNHLLSSSDDNTIRLWGVGSDHCLRVFSHSNFVTCVEFNPVNDDYFISGCLDGKVRMWSVSSCQVVDWIDVKELVTAICYSPDAQGGIVGTMAGSCHFFNISGNLLHRGPCIHLHSKKKSPFKKITSFQFLPHDNTKVMVTSADSQVRIIHGLDVIKKYKGPRTTGYTTASITTEGKHIVATCDDTHVYVWNCNTDEGPVGSQAKKISSLEHFSANASVAITWDGLKLSNVDMEKSTDNTLVSRSSSLPCTTPACFCLKHGYLLDTFPKGTATWPAENLPTSNPIASRSSSLRKSQYKLFKTSCQSTSKSHAWGLVIVAGGWDGRIRSFHNYGLPVVT